MRCLHPLVIIAILALLRRGSGLSECYPADNKPIEALRQGEDIRAHVRAVLEEALKSLLEATGAGFVQSRAVGECAVLRAQLGDLESARRTLRQARDLIQASLQVPVEEWRNLAKSCAAKRIARPRQP